MKHSLLVSALALCSLQASAGDWHSEVTTAIESGKFKEAKAIMNAQPKTRENLVTIDSFQIIMNRISYDFSLTPAKGVEMVRERIPGVTDNEINSWIEKKYIETMTIDGETKWMRKSVRNLFLLNPDLIVPEAKDGSGTALLQYRTTALAMPADANHCHNWNRATITFTLTVDADAVPAGEILKAWIPVPLTSPRQRNFRLISSSSNAIISQNSAQHTAMLEQKAVKGRPTVFTIKYSYDVAAQYFDFYEILSNLKPYDTTTAEYKTYTSTSTPHVIITDEMRAMARKIVGTETNPAIQAKMIYNWIGDTFPWAGARDYSTIPNIPQYVLEQRHGDCGQVSLLYITLCRSLGIPARWESGWMLHPHEHNYHDWCETYFEGVGWVPTDVSFGRSTNPVLRQYYQTGTDMYRMAANSDIAQAFDPKKTYIRCETIDSQAGEVEWRKGNLEMTQWDSHLEVNSMIPINY